jgi:hypothetical protein
MTEFGTPPTRSFVVCESIKPIYCLRLGNHCMPLKCPAVVSDFFTSLSACRCCPPTPSTAKTNSSPIDSVPSVRISRCLRSAPCHAEG